MFKGPGRAGKNLAGGSLKYLFTCFKNRIFKKRYRKIVNDGVMAMAKMLPRKADRALDEEGTEMIGKMAYCKYTL